MSIENGMTATHRLGNRVTAKGLGGRGTRPDAFYHAGAPTAAELRTYAFILACALIPGLAGLAMLAAI